jgi:hypothetical protein
MRRLLELQTTMLLIHFLALARLGTPFTPAPGGRHWCQDPMNTISIYAWQHPQVDPCRRSTDNACRPTTSCVYPFHSVADRSHGRLASLQASNEVAPERSNKDDEDPSFDQDAKDLGFSLVVRFLESFWKGITLPFPALRRIALHPDFTDKKQKPQCRLDLSRRTHYFGGLLSHRCLLLSSGSRKVVNYRFSVLYLYLLLNCWLRGPLPDHDSVENIHLRLWTRWYCTFRWGPRDRRWKLCSSRDKHCQKGSRQESYSVDADV